MFEVNDIVVLHGWTFCQEVLKDNNNKFKVVNVTPGTFAGPEGFQFHVEGVVDGTYQIFSTITLEDGDVTVVKVDAADVAPTDTIGIVEGAKVRTTATGNNPDFTAGKDYEIEEVVDQSDETSLVIIEDDTGYPCFCLISNRLDCPHAGSWEVIAEVNLEQKTEGQLQDFLKGSHYELSGSVFCDYVLEANDSIFTYNGFDVDDSHEFIGCVDGEKQWVTVRSIKSSDRNWASVKPV